MAKIIDNTNLGYLISKIKATFWPKTDVVQIGLDNTPTANSDNLVKSGGVKTALDAKQDALVSGTNIKTINNESLLGSGNINISGGGGSGEANVIEAITFNGTPATITNKTAAITATIPSEVTESTVSGWGFTKNTGTLTGVSFNGSAATVTNGVASITATIPSTLDQITDGSTRKLSDYVPKSGGTLNNSATLTLPSASTDDTVIGNGVMELQGGSGEVGVKLDGVSAAVCVSSESAIISSTTAQTKYRDGSIIKRRSNTDYTLTIPSKTGTLAVTTDIPSAVTESTVSGWGFTKNAAPGTLITTATTAQTASSGEAMSGNITLHKVAKTGTYSDLIGTPTIPTKVSDLTNDSNFTSNTGTVTGVKINGTTKTPTSGTVDLGTVLTSETSLSKGTTTGSGNAVTDISVSGHQITLTKGSTFLTSETSLSKGTTTGSGNAVTDISVSGHKITLTKGTTFLTSHQDISGKANLSGAAFTGAVTGTSSGNTAQFRNVTISSSEPTSSQGSNGDIWIVV